MNHNQNDKYVCICHEKAQQDEKSYNGCIVCLVQMFELWKENTFMSHWYTYIIERIGNKLFQLLSLGFDEYIGYGISFIY